MTPLTDKMATSKEVMKYKTYRPTMEEFSNFKVIFKKKLVPLKKVLVNVFSIS